MPTSSILRTATGLHELRLQGYFPHPHCVAFLLSGLANSQVSVISGRAFQKAPQEWEVLLNLDFARSKAAAETLDYVAMAQQKPASTDMAAPRISRYEIVRHTEGLEVRLEGPDQIGFLGRFLGRMALLMLFPRDIEIATIAGQIKDRVVFHGVGNIVPDATAQASLDTLLRGLVAAD